MPEIPVKIAGKEQWALFDTGCGMTVVDQAVIDANPKSVFNRMKRPSMVNKGKSSLRSKIPPASWSAGKTYVATEIEIEGSPKSAQLVTAIPFSRELKDKLQASVIFGVNSMMAANWFLDFTTNQWAASAFSAKKEKMPHFQVDAGEAVPQR